MLEMLPPPLTSAWPRRASAVPSSRATATYPSSMAVLDEQ
jgi:hypothetical protein